MFISDNYIPILEKCFLFGGSRLHDLQVVVKKYVLSITLNKRISQLLRTEHHSNQNTSFQSINFVIFLFHIVFMNYIDNLRYLREISLFSFSITILTFIYNSPLLFFQNDPKTRNSHKKVSMGNSFLSKLALDSMNIILLLLIIYKKYNRQYVPLFFHLSDNSIIRGVDLGCDSDNIDQGRSYFDTNITISHCFFSRSSLYNGNGGVIYVNAGSYSMNVSYSMFYNCIAIEGGAIYFSSLNSYLRMICLNRCSCGSSSWYHSVYLYASQMNQVEYQSVSYCSHTTYGYYSMRLSKGNQRVDNINSSMNNAKEGSGILIDSPSLFTSTYCTFSNNKVSDSICIHFYSSSGTESMSYANIVQNISPNNGVVFVSGAGSRKMLYYIFQNNQNILFSVHSGTLEVSHSFIDHSLSFSTSLAVSTAINNSFSKRMTYQIRFFNSLHCNADMPLIDRTPLQTFEKSPMRSFEETLRMTFERTIDQTIRETLIETIHISNTEIIFTHQMNNWREISVIFSFSYPAIILMIC